MSFIHYVVSVEFIKKVPFCLACIILLRPNREAIVTDVVRDTVFSTDTVRMSAPVASSGTVVRYEPYPVIIPNDTIRDTVFVYIPITQKVYRDSLYTAWISGYSVKLDSIELYNKVQTISVHEKVKCKRFGIGLQVGYGYPHGGYAGVGVSYNLFQW